MYRTRGDKTGTSVSHAAATKLSALYRQISRQELQTLFNNLFTSCQACLGVEVHFRNPV